MLLALDGRDRVARFGHAHHAHRIVAPLNSTRILPYVAVNKDAFPNGPACAAGRIKSFRLPKQAQVSCVSFQAQYQAFVRFAVKSCAASKKPSRSNGPAFWNLSLGAGSRLRTLASTAISLRGYLRSQQPWTDVVVGT
jgi:hypothetical protein